MLVKIPHPAPILRCNVWAYLLVLTHMHARLLRETYEPELLTPDSRLQEGNGTVLEVPTLPHHSKAVDVT